MYVINNSVAFAENIPHILVGVWVKADAIAVNALLVEFFDGLAGVVAEGVWVVNINVRWFAVGKD